MSATSLEAIWLQCMGAALQAQDRVTVHGGDCLEVLAMLPEASIDAVVTDPPYHLKSGNRGFMGKEWDGGDVAFRPETWAAVLRVLKPGGHMVAFSGTRTCHRMVCAIEDAGFEIRNQLAWIYGSGFPKSLDVSKSIDKMLTGIVRGAAGKPTRSGASFGQEYERNEIGPPISPEAAAWQGWGSDLKPALEPICLARKPLSESSIARNVLRHGTGAINVDGCRAPMSANDASAIANMGGFGRATWRGSPRVALSESLNNKVADAVPHTAGRFPANVIHDGSDEVVGMFPAQAGGTRSAARFFYCAKASKRERAGSKHPTVKPVALIRWLVRLITPSGGTVLDPFAGTGTTGEAAICEGCNAVLIEREAEHLDDITRRLERIGR